MPLLEVKELVKVYGGGKGLLRQKTAPVCAVDHVSFSIEINKTLAIVGESGCGKSTTAKCIIRLETPTAGQVIFNGEDLAQLSPEAMRLRRRHIQMIYQDPFSSLNPRMSVFSLLAEPLRTHKLGDKNEIRKKVEEMADMIGLSREQLSRYPHQFSGGQRQRISIGRALVTRPSLILADEPVSALDVSIQAQVLNLLADLQDELGLTMLFISHDLNVVQHVSDHIAVMYLGSILEMGPTRQVCENPQHPYTIALMDSVPKLDPSARRERPLLEGDVLSLSQRPEGCLFGTRCKHVQPCCREKPPAPVEVTPGHYVSCYLFGNEDRP